MAEDEGLVGTFGPPALANLLSRRATAAPAEPAPAPAPPESPPVSNPAEPSQGPTGERRPPAPATPAGRRLTKAAPPRPSTPTTTAKDDATAHAPDDELTSQVSVYLLPELLQTVRRARATTARGRTNADLAFEAIDATHRKLAELIAARRTGSGRPGSLFPARRTGRAGADSARRVLWSMKATPVELAVIDRLVAETSAASRSELIATAMEAHLLPRRR
jgi:hypothetical protein